MASCGQLFLKSAAAAAIFLVVIQSGFAGDVISRGAMLANSCAACHGTDGSGAGRIPRINDLSKKDLLELMQGFRTGERPSTIMDRHAKGYTDDEVGQIADHFASLKK